MAADLQFITDQLNSLRDRITAQQAELATYTTRYDGHHAAFVAAETQMQALHRRRDNLSLPHPATT